MANVLKVLGQQIPAAGVVAVIYAPSSVRTATVSTVTACNQGPATTIRLLVNVFQDGLGDVPKQYIVYDLPLAANDTYAATMGITLASQDGLRCSSANGAVSFSAFGVEVA